MDAASFARDHGVEAKQWAARAALNARQAGHVLSRAPEEQRNASLLLIAARLREATPQLLAINAVDVAEFSGTEAFRERLTLTPQRIEAIALGIGEIASLDDPVGKSLDRWTRPNGLSIDRVTVPIGVIGMIFESRPNVGIEAAALGIKSGNAMIVRGGKDSFRTSRYLMDIVAAALAEVGLPDGAVQMPPHPDREYVGEMLAATQGIDLIIPRGGRSLVERVQAESRIPVLAHAQGLCHTYIHRDANLSMARSVLANAKMRRVSICGATETLLLDAAIAATFLPVLVDDLRALGCDFRADLRARDILPFLPPASLEDFMTEWEDAILSIAIVDDVDVAVSHVNAFGSAHTDAIITENEDIASRFIKGVDSAVTMWNASTQFSDGGEFGFGAEIGISTGRLHARGPIGVEQMVTFRYIVSGKGQTRS